MKRLIICDHQKGSTNRDKKASPEIKKLMLERGKRDAGKKYVTR